MSSNWKVGNRAIHVQKRREFVGYSVSGSKERGFDYVDAVELIGRRELGRDVVVGGMTRKLSVRLKSSNIVLEANSGAAKLGGGMEVGTRNFKGEKVTIVKRGNRGGN